MTTLARYRRAIREDAMQLAITDLVTMRNGRLFHVRRSDNAPELVDLPDLLILAPWIGNGTVLLVELKSAKRPITAGQQAVMDLAASCSRFDSMIVRSTDPREGEIAYDDFLDYLGRS